MTTGFVEFANNDPIREIVQLLTRLPGIGEKSARRIAYHLLSAEPAFARALGEAVATLASRVRKCDPCGAFTAQTRCNICMDRSETMTCCVSSLGLGT